MRLLPHFTAEWSLRCGEIQAAAAPPGPWVGPPRCRPGFAPVLTTQCVTELPIFECVWLSSGRYDCWVKRWECTESRQVWTCALSFRARDLSG